MAKITFLGSGCWQGVPGQFCDDSVSKNATWGSKDFRFRTSLFLESNDVSAVVEITPDIRLQAWKFSLPVPTMFFVSHWHWDHLFGLKDLDWFCEKNNPLVYGSKEVQEWYLKDMSYIPVQFKIFEDFSSVSLGDVVVSSFPVLHVEGSQGFLFTNNKTGKKIVYFGDLCGLPETSREHIGSVDVAIVDATYSEGNIDDDTTHFVKKDLFDFLESLDAKKIILTHISSFHNLDHEALQKKYPQYVISYDGMELIF